MIALENTRLLGELRERTRDLQESLDYQIATSDVLKVINRSTSDLQLVLDTLVEIAVRLCKADTGALSIREGNLYRAAANFGFFPEHKAFAQTQPQRPGHGGVVARVLLGRRPVHVLDIASDPEHFAPEMVTLGDMRTVLGVPLLREGEPIGVIGLSRSRVEAFTEQQIELVSTFADQVVIAIENARLLTETREALEQQTATAEVLGVINSSPGDLVPVFEALLDKALRLCEASYGTLLTWDGERLHRSAFRGASVELLEALGGSEPVMPPPGSVADRLLRGEDIIYTADITQDPSFVRSPRVQILGRVGGFRGYIAVPLRKDNRLLGFIAIYRREVRPFTDKQIALLQNFAAQAVIAMENARLLGELRERTHQLEQSLEYQTATSDVLQVISRSGADLEPVLQTLVETAARICDADKAVIHQARDGLYWMAASFGFSQEYNDYSARNPLAPGRGTTTGRMALERRAVQIEDWLNDPEHVGGELGQLAQVRTGLAVPLFREDEIVGSFFLARTHVQLCTEKQIALVTTFADQAVIAMENARLLDELHQRTDQVAELNRGLEARVAEQVEELGRVGRLKRFLAPQLAELIVSQGDEKILESHRQEIVVVFCDLRGYTAFTETAEPEEVLNFLREYHGALGPLVSQYEGTLDQFSGDGIMVFFNDPVPIPDPAERAVKMAMAMREEAGKLIASWRRRDRELGFGAGIAQGYATLGQIGFAERSGYTAIGTVCNLAARLCAEARDGQILVSGRVAAAVEQAVPLEDLGSLALKGLSQPVSAFNVPLAATQPALRVIEGGPPSV